VTHAEAVGNHVLLAQSALGPVGPDAVAQCTKEPCIIGREFSTGTHHSKLRQSRAKPPRTNLRIERYCPIICDSIPYVRELAGLGEFVARDSGKRVLGLEIANSGGHT
jgi:hypothetical protein